MPPVRFLSPVLLLLLSAAGGDGPRWLEDETEARRESAKTGKPVYLLLIDPSTSDGKAHLKDLERKEIAQHLEKFILLRIDAAKNKGAQAKYDAKALPYSHFMKSDGTPIKSIHGKISSSTLAKQIEQVLEKVAAPPLVSKPPERKEIKPGPAAGKPIAHAPSCPDGCDVCRRALEKALAFLAAKQKGDGRWERIERAEPPDGMKPGSEYLNSIDHIDVVLTAVCGLALLSESGSVKEGRYKTHLEKAVSFLLSCVRADGNVAETEKKEDVWQIYANFQTPFAALFLAEAAQSDPSPALKAKLAAIAKYIELEQEKGGGWGYGRHWKERPAGDKYGRALVAVAVCNLTALGQLRAAGVKVSDDALKRGAEYLGRCRSADGGYTYSETMPIGSSPGRTAGVLYALRRSGASDPAALKRGDDFLRRTFAHAEYYSLWMWFSHLFTALALHEVGGGVDYRKAHVDGFLATQREDGSWVDPDGMGGVLFATAACAIVLQMETGHLPLIHHRGKPREAEKQPEVGKTYLPMPTRESRVKIFKAAGGAGYRVDLIVSAEGALDNKAKAALKGCFEKVNTLLFDLTDGQMALEGVDLYDGKREWEKADIRLCAKEFPGLHGRTVVGTDVTGGREGRRIGEFIELPLRRGWEGDQVVRVVAHELGHYLFGLRDEYNEASGEVACRGCLMGGASLGVTEFCRPGAHKGDCWTTMKGLYPDLKVPASEDPGPWRSPPPTITVR